MTCIPVCAIARTSSVDTSICHENTFKELIIHLHMILCACPMSSVQACNSNDPERATAGSSGGDEGHSS
jgi:hypothetical protein